MHELRDIGQCVCSCLMPSSFVMNGLVLFLGSEVRIQDIQLVLLHYSYKLHLQSLHVYVYKDKCIMSSSNQLQGLIL